MSDASQTTSNHQNSSLIQSDGLDGCKLRERFNYYKDEFKILSSTSIDDYPSSDYVFDVLERFDEISSKHGPIGKVIVCEKGMVLPNKFIVISSTPKFLCNMIERGCIDRVFLSFDEDFYAVTAQRGDILYQTLTLRLAPSKLTEEKTGEVKIGDVRAHTISNYNIGL